MTRHVFMFQPRFARGVIDGTKYSTIRLPRKQKVACHDTLDLRTWSGIPYRSKQVKLREVKCTNISYIRIESGEHVRLGGCVLNPFARRSLAETEGFADWADMFAWFATTHALPFTATRYHWIP